MNKTALSLLIVFGIFSLSAKSQAAGESVYRVDSKTTQADMTSNLGVGFKWGTLTGVNIKYWTMNDQAVDLTSAFANGNTALGVDYLFHSRHFVHDLIAARQSYYFAPYVGGGLISAFGSDTNFFNRDTGNFGLAARVPIGVEFLPPGLPLGAFAEFAPAFGFTPTTYTFITADVGARYYF